MMKINNFKIEKECIVKSRKWRKEGGEEKRRIKSGDIEEIKEKRRGYAMREASSVLGMDGFNGIPEATFALLLFHRLGRSHSRRVELRWNELALHNLERESRMTT